MPSIFKSKFSFIKDLFLSVQLRIVLTVSKKEKKKKKRRLRYQLFFECMVLLTEFYEGNQGGISNSLWMRFRKQELDLRFEFKTPQS